MPAIFHNTQMTHAAYISSKVGLSRTIPSKEKEDYIPSVNEKKACKNLISEIFTGFHCPDIFKTVYRL